MSQDVVETTNTSASDTIKADSYVERLGLEADPFSPDFESDYFYAEAGRRALLDQAIHLARFSDQLVILSGATGVGTSTVLDEIFIQLQDVIECCDVNAEKEGLLDSMLGVLADQLHFQFPQSLTPENFIEALKADTYLDIEPEPVLLAIDQAHFIAMESLEALHLIKQLAGNRVKLILVGEFQIEQLALLAGFSHEQISILQLEPLNEAESADYLHGLLTAAGYKGGGDLPLSSDQLAILYEQSQGNITDINRLAPALLVADKPIAKVGARFVIPLPHIIAAAILFVALMLSYFYKSDEPSALPVESANTQPLSEPQAMGRQVELLKEKEKSQIRPVKKAEKEPVALNSLNNTPALPDIVEAPQASLATKTLPSEELPPSTSILSEPARPVKKDQARAVNPDETAVVTEVLDADIDAPRQLGQQTKVAGTAPRAIAAKEPKQAIALLERSVKYQEVPVTVAASEVDAINEYPAREQRLLDMPKSQYMLQLFGAYEEERVREFVKQYVGRLSITYFETRHQDRPWYVVVTGPYDNREQAKAGISVLPVTLQRQKPWARSVDNIQLDIKKRQ